MAANEAAGTNKRGKSRKAAVAIGPEERRQFVALAAYYIAERRGFDGKSALDDWVEAESQIDTMIATGNLVG